MSWSWRWTVGREVSQGVVATGCLGLGCRQRCPDRDPRASLQRCQQSWHHHQLRLRVTPEALCWETADPLIPLSRGRANNRGHGSRGGAPDNGRALGLEQTWVRDGCDAWKTCVEMRPSRKPAFAESEAHTHPSQKPTPNESEANHACTVESPPQAPSTPPGISRESLRHHPRHLSFWHYTPRGRERPRTFKAPPIMTALARGCSGAGAAHLRLTRRLSLSPQANSCN